MISFMTAALLAASVPASCAAGCDASPLTPIAEAAAGFERATSCAPTLELEDTVYMQVGCPSVRSSLLGPVVARGSDYVARSIDGVPITSALAIKLLHDAGRCSGWSFWADVVLIDEDPRAANNLARQVNRTGSLT